MTGHTAIWICYGAGQALHVLLQADAIARAKNNSFDRRLEILKQNAVRLAARVFGATMLFIFWWKNPGALVTVLQFCGVSVSESVAAMLSLPMSAPIAGACGLTFDVLLGFIPGFRNAFPPAEDKE